MFVPQKVGFSCSHWTCCSPVWKVFKRVGWNMMHYTFESMIWHLRWTVSRHTDGNSLRSCNWTDFPIALDHLQLRNLLCWSIELIFSHSSYRSHDPSVKNFGWIFSAAMYPATSLHIVDGRYPLFPKQRGHTVFWYASSIFPVNFHTNGSCEMSMCISTAQTRTKRCSRNHRPAFFV